MSNLFINMWTRLVLALQLLHNLIFEFNFHLDLLKFLFPLCYFLFEFRLLLADGLFQVVDLIIVSCYSFNLRFDHFLPLLAGAFLHYEVELVLLFFHF